MQRKLHKDKKGQVVNALNILPTVAITVGLFVIIGAVMALVVDELQDSLDTQNTTSVAFNVTERGLETQENLFDNAPLLGTIIILGVIVIVILSLFAFRRRGF